MAGSLTPEALAVEHPREVWLITVAHGVNEFYGVALPPVLPLLVADFDITYGQAGGLITVFFVMYSVFQLPAGLLADRVGQKRLLAGGMALLSGGLFVVAVADSYLVMLAGQAVAGVGGSTYHPSGMSLISDLEPGATEGRAMGIHGFGGVAGMALAPALVGGLAALFDWRLALSVAAVVGVAYAGVFLVLFSAPVRAPASDGGPASDASGGLPDGRRESDGGERAGGSRASSDGRADVGERAGGSRAPPDGRPGTADESLRGRVRALVAVPAAGWVAVLFAISFLVSFEIGAVRTFAPTYLFTRLGGSTWVANGIYFVMLLGAGVASLGAGNLADRFDRTAAGALIFGLSAVLLAVTALVPPSAGAMLGWFLVLGLVLYAVSPMKNALTAGYAEESYSGSLFGIMLSASSLGGALGPVLLGVVAERVGWLVTFPAIGLVAVVGAGAFLLLKRS